MKFPPFIAGLFSGASKGAHQPGGTIFAGHKNLSPGFIESLPESEREPVIKNSIQFVHDMLKNDMLIPWAAAWHIAGLIRLLPEKRQVSFVMDEMEFINHFAGSGAISSGVAADMRRPLGTVLHPKEP